MPGFLYRFEDLCAETTFSMIVKHVLQNNPRFLNGEKLVDLLTQAYSAVVVQAAVVNEDRLDVTELI